MKHDTTHEGLLERALTGAGSAAVTETLRSCPECRIKLAELRQLEVELIADAADEHEIVEDSQAEATAADEAAVSEALERGRRARPNKPWRLRLLLLALAACFVAFLTLREGQPKTAAAPSEVSLGGDFAVRIQVEAGRYDSVEWDCELSPGESFELSFQELESGGIGRTVQTITGLASARFTPPAELERSLPEGIIAVVLVRDVNGLPRAQASAAASRR